MTLDRFTSDFDRIFAGPTPEYSQCFCKGPQGRQRECPCALAQKEIESGTHMRAADLRPALCTEASPTRTSNTIGDGNHG